MKKHLLLLCTLLTSYLGNLSAELQIQTTDHESLVNHLIGIKNTFDDVYAPKEWKKQHSGWDINSSVQEVIAKISKNPNITLKDYQHMLLKMFTDVKDYHTSIYFYSTEFSALPFRVRGAEGRYFVAWIEPSIASSFPLNIGDEVISFDHRPIGEVIQELTFLDKHECIEETDLELASIFLTKRAGVLGHYVPKGKVDVVVLPNGKDDTATYTFEWIYRNELIKGLHEDQLVKNVNQDIKQEKSPLGLIKHFNKYSNFTSTLSTKLQKYHTFRPEGEFPIGDRRGPLPELGNVVWKNPPKKFFYSYIYKNEKGKNIGYIRIPHFNGDDEEEGKDIEELCMLVRAFQRKTDCLVIDLVDNIGGILDNLLTYLGLLTDKELPFYKQRISITQSDVMECFQYLAFIEEELNAQKKPDELTPYLLQFKDYFELVIAEWNAGRYLSDPIYIYGIDRVIPNPKARYSKPILILANGLDFSCGDFFPAVMQDSGRAKIFGSKTAGAGGAIVGHSYPNKLGIESYTYTITIAVRTNGLPIESLGVTPDFPYNLTVNDMKNNYEDYIKAVNQAVNSMMN